MLAIEAQIDKILVAQGVLQTEADHKMGQQICFITSKIVRIDKELNTKMEQIYKNT